MEWFEQMMILPFALLKEPAELEYAYCWFESCFYGSKLPIPLLQNGLSLSLIQRLFPPSLGS